MLCSLSIHLFLQLTLSTPTEPFPNCLFPNEMAQNRSSFHIQRFFFGCFFFFQFSWYHLPTRSLLCFFAQQKRVLVSAPQAIQEALFLPTCFCSTAVFSSAKRINCLVSAPPHNQYRHNAALPHLFIVAVAARRCKKNVTFSVHLELTTTFSLRQVLNSSGV